jgi:hypothetical protein
MLGSVPQLLLVSRVSTFASVLRRMNDRDLCLPELADVFESMERLRLEFEGLARPSGLPPPGEPLPCAEEPAVAPAQHQHQQVLSTWQVVHACVFPINSSCIGMRTLIQRDDVFVLRPASHFMWSCSHSGYRG